MCQALRRRLDRTLESILVILMSGMVLNVLWQITTRYLLGDPSSVTEEIARFGLIWLGMLGASYGFGRKVHLSVGLVDEFLDSRIAKDHPLRIGLELVSLGCVGIFAALILVVGGSNLVSLSSEFNQASAALGVPLGAVYSVLPISGAIVLFYSGLQAIELSGRWRAWGGEG